MDGTPRARMLAVLRKQLPAFVPFFPKLYGPWLSFHEEELAGTTLNRLLEQSRAVYMLPLENPLEIRRPAVAEDVIDDGDSRVRRIVTPLGELRAVQRRTAESKAFHPVEPLIKNREDLERACFLYEDVDLSAAERSFSELAAIRSTYPATGVTFTLISQTPIMQLLKEDIGPANTVYFLMDYPGEMAKLMELMYREGIRVTKAVLESFADAIDCFVTGEDTSTAYLSPGMFRELCVPFLNAQSELVHRRRAVHLVHMCGSLSAVLPDMAALDADGFEALTTRPVGDITIDDIGRNLSGKIVVGGGNAAQWMRCSAGQIIDTIEDTFRRRPADSPALRNLVLSSGGEMPPPVEIEKIRKVGSFLWDFAV